MAETTTSSAAMHVSGIRRSARQRRRWQHGMLPRVRQHVARVLCSLLLLGAGSALQADMQLQPFTPQSLQQIEQQHAGKPFLLVLWSLTCAPCFAELALLAQALEAEPELPVVLVATDPPQLRAEVEATLTDYGLLGHAGWQFDDVMPGKLRFHIDPDWFGELPRSYFYDAAGQRSGHSGALTSEQIRRWVRTRALPAGAGSTHH